MAPGNIQTICCTGSATVPRHGRNCSRRSIASGRKTLLKYVMVGIGGFLGAIARFWLGGYVGDRMGSRFPWGTFIINCSGSFVIGFIITLLAERTHWSPNWRYLIPVGFVGAYTTFSTFEYETLRAMQDGNFVIAALNIVLSVALGFVAVWMGVVAGQAIP